LGFTVAIDGYTAAGKGTVPTVAAHFGYAFGHRELLYRAVGAKVLNSMDALKAAQMPKPSIWTAMICEILMSAQAASRVAVNSDDTNRGSRFGAIATRWWGECWTGRDIGAVICVDADVSCS
jgi:cytidylate kinase